MAGTHRKPKATPYAIAVGSVSYALAITFAKHIPVDVLASAPAAITAAVAAVEHGVADVERVDPKLTPVGAKVDRLAAQAASAAQDVAKVVSAGVAAAPAVDAAVALVKPVV